MLNETGIACTTHSQYRPQMNFDQTLSRFEHDFAELLACAPSMHAQQLLAAAEHVYLMAPSSFIGISYAPILARRLADQRKRIVLVDDHYAEQGIQLENWPVISSQTFVSQARRGEKSVAVNLAYSPFAHGYFSQVSAKAEVSELDIVAVMDLLHVPVIYQTASLMRSHTVARADDYRALVRRFTDPLSVNTLLALLKLRLNLDRMGLLPVLCSQEDEYFTSYPGASTDTFKLHSQEVLCDVGAHVGSTINKFLNATRWKYSAIHAFEPDVENYRTLKEGHFATLPNFHSHNIALSDACSVLQFAQSGTMGSRLAADGNVQVQARPLDDVVDYATFVKMDVEGHETSVLRGARKLIHAHQPRLAVTGYHYANDLLDIVELILELEPRYELRLRHHSFYFYDSIIYAEVRP
jgi:FkbM family methyltransferase